MLTPDQKNYKIELLNNLKSKLEVLDHRGGTQYLKERILRSAEYMIEFIPKDIFDQSYKHLDIGCGPGNTCIAASLMNAYISIGVDKNIHSHDGKIRIENINNILSKLNVEDKIILINGLLGEEFDIMPQTFDLITLIDVIEHLKDVNKVISTSFELLRTDGILFIDTLPLYYSPVGHHLWPYFTEKKWPWAHLRKDFAKLISEVLPTNLNLSDFYSLNKITHDEIKNIILKNNFTIIFEHKDHKYIHPGRYELFLENKKYLQLENINEDVLFEARTIFVAKK